MYVIKRSKNNEIRRELVQFDKVTRRIQKLMYNLDSTVVDPAYITQQICIRIYSGVTTTELDNLAAQFCMSKVVDHPDFGKLGSRLAISNHQKNTPESFIQAIKELRQNRDIIGEPAPLINDKFYDIASKYQKEIDKMIDHDRDYLLDYFGFKTLEKSYLLRINMNEKEQKIIERPQHLFMRVALCLHGEDLENVKKTYDNFSLKKCTMATPTLFNSGCQISQLSSCFLVSTEDSILGIYNTITECALISKWSGGIGIHISNIRSNGAYIRKTGGKSDGIVPMLKMYNDTACYVNQGGGKRNGSFACYLEPWHPDVFEFLEAKQKNGDEKRRARDLFYALWVPDLFMHKVEKNEDWYLMDPDACPGLPDVYGEEFNELYNKYVLENKYKKKIKARQLWEEITKSQIENGTPYIGYKDHVNKKSNQKNIDTIRSSNLCIEINQVSNKEETACCNLGSICLPSIVEHPLNEDKTRNENWYNLLELGDKMLYNFYIHGNLLLYSTENCVFCKLLKALLSSLNLTYTEITSEEAEQLRLKCSKEIRDSEVLSKPFETVPQLFTVIQNPDIDEFDTYHLGGYTDSWRILSPRINYQKLADMSYDMLINLNKVIDLNDYPIEKAKISNMRHRPVGLGVNGLADVFMILKIPYDSDEAKDINKKIFETMYYGAMKSSCDIAKKDGRYSTFDGSPLSQGLFQFNLWDKKDEDLSGLWNWEDLRKDVMENGVRNSLLIALMPTASSASIYGYNEAFEAITSNLYTRKTLGGDFVMINKYLINDLMVLGLWTQEVKDRLIFDNGSVQNIKELPSFLKNIYKTVYEISYKKIIEMSAERGQFVCQSQSLNLFFDNPDFKTLTTAHFYGFKLGLKTGSYYIRTKPATNAQKFGLDAAVEKKFKNEAIKNVEDEEICTSCQS